MTRDVLSVRANATVQSAAWSLATQSVGGAPVRDSAGHVTGILSKSDVVDSVRVHDEPKKTKVESVMTPVVWAVHPDDSALDAATLMVDKGIHRVVVLDGPGQLAGIVTATDILRALIGGKDFGPPPARARRAAAGASEVADATETPTND